MTRVRFIFQKIGARDYTTSSLPRRPARSSSLLTMLGIGGVFARFIEGRVSWTRVIARDADLYGKRFRHWSTAEPNSILVWLVLVWLACYLTTSTGATNGATKQQFKIKNGQFTMLFRRSSQYYERFSSAGCFVERRRRRRCWSSSCCVIFQRRTRWTFQNTISFIAWSSITG